MPRCPMGQRLSPQASAAPNPTKRQRPRRLEGWAERSDTPWETVEVEWYGGQRKTLGVFARMAWW
jgi:hypothetical protein